MKKLYVVLSILFLEAVLISIFSKKIDLPVMITTLFGTMSVFIVIASLLEARKKGNKMRFPSAGKKSIMGATR